MLDDLQPVSETEVAGRVRAEVDDARRRVFATPAALARYVMGRLMDDLIGRVEGMQLAELLERAIAPVPIIETTIAKQVRT